MRCNSDPCNHLNIPLTPFLQNNDHVAQAVKAELSKAMTGFGFEVIQVRPLSVSQGVGLGDCHRRCKPQVMHEVALVCHLTGSRCPSLRRRMVT